MRYQLKYKLLSSLLMSFFMATVMSGCIMATQYDIRDIIFLSAWRDAFFFAWPIAFPTAFFIQPLVQRLVKILLPKE